MRDLAAEKARVYALLDGLAKGLPVAEAFGPEALVRASHPYGVLQGLDEIEQLYKDLRFAIPDVEWRPEIFIAGENQHDARVTTERQTPLVASMGHYQGTFVAPLLGIPPTNGVVHLRVCEVYHLNDDGLISHGWTIIDHLDLAHQAGVFPLPPMPGASGMWPGPKGGGGVRLTQTDPMDGLDALGRVFVMHDALHEFDGKSVTSVPMHHWTDDFMYYAAAGIGMCRGVDGFRQHHQIPFLRGFPDRYGSGHFVRIGDGNFALTGGRVKGSHLGDYLGMAPTARSVGVDVMDFYRFDDNGLIAENWLPFDILGLANQMGVDLLGRIAHLAGNPRKDI